MKRFLIICISFCFSLAISAEKEQKKLLVDGRTWNYMSFYYTGAEPDTVYHSISINGPVEFEGKQCYKFSNELLEEATNFFYEENGKVYCYDYEIDDDLEENYYWLEEFNFDLKAGEKGVISVDTIIYEGASYRCLRLFDDVWIEGFGSIKSGVFSSWREVPGTFMGSKVISIYDGEKCVFIAEDFFKADIITYIPDNKSNLRITNACFDLQGRPVKGTSKHGVYVKDGRKVVR